MHRNGNVDLKRGATSREGVREGLDSKALVL